MEQDQGLMDYTLAAYLVSIEASVLLPWLQYHQMKPLVMHQVH